MHSREQCGVWGFCHLIQNFQRNDPTTAYKQKIVLLSLERQTIKKHALASRLKWQSEALHVSQSWLTMVVSFLVGRDINSFRQKWSRRILEKQSLNLATVSSPLSRSPSREVAGRPGRTNGDKTYVEIVNCDHGDLAIGPIVLTHSLLQSLSSTVTMLPTGGKCLYSLCC